jgi:signal transduction histidine kinase
VLVARKQLDQMANGSKKKYESARPSILRRTLEADRFEAVLSHALAAMALVSAHDIDREIESWLGEISATLDLDRSAIIHLGRGVTHRWSRAGIPLTAYGATAMRISPYATRRVLSGEEIVWSQGMPLPPEADDYKRWLNDEGLKAQVSLPFRVGGRTVGGVTFGKFRSGREWPSQIIQRLRLVAKFLAHLLQRRDIELQLESVRSELTIASGRMMMGELVASISNEVNQPLGAILSNAQSARRLLSGDHSAIAEVMPALSDIVEDAERASEIVRRVRSMFKGDETSKSTLIVEALLEEARALLRSEAAIRKIALTVEIEPGLPGVLGDRIQLLQCVTNLILNGFDSIAAADSVLREVTVRAAQSEAGYVSVSVKDSGPGIEPALLERIFDTFVTTKPQGLGLGLHVARSIVEGHGGKIWAASDKGGATFTFALPAVADSNGAGSHSTHERRDQGRRDRRRRLRAQSA